MMKAQPEHWISDDARWRDAHPDRIQRTVARDFNHPSVVLRSLGNVSGDGENLAATCRWCRENAPTRLVHDGGDRLAATADATGATHVNPVKTEPIGRGEESFQARGGVEVTPAHHADLSFLHRESAHAMGNEPNGLAAHRDATWRHPRLCRACVWEWLDHGLLTKLRDGHERIAYGGDFGDQPNGNCDGLLFSDRTPTPGLAELKQARAPVLARHLGGTRSELTNRFNHADLSRLRCRWTQQGQGEEVTGGSSDLPDLGPGESAELEIHHAPVGAGERHLTLRFALVEATAWADAGHEVAVSQFGLDPGSPPEAPPPEAEPAVIAFDAAAQRLNLGGFACPRLTLWRSPIANEDRGAGENVAAAWRKKQPHLEQHHTDARRPDPGSPGSPGSPEAPEAAAAPGGPRSPPSARRSRRSATASATASPRWPAASGWTSTPIPSATGAARRRSAASPSRRGCRSPRVPGERSGSAAAPASATRTATPPPSSAATGRRSPTCTRLTPARRTTGCGPASAGPASAACSPRSPAPATPNCTGTPPPTSTPPTTPTRCRSVTNGSCT